MSSGKTISFDELPRAELFIDAIYEGGNAKNAGDDPISKLVGCGNQGGFRYTGSIRTGIHLCVLYSELSDPDWPDSLDIENGLFTYFGDNKKPGGLHDTRKKGNEILRLTFNSLHIRNRSAIPPFFVFTKGPKGRDVAFRGLAVPGGKGISQTEDLVAVWKTKAERRFQNYRALFTVLKVDPISRVWIDELRFGQAATENAPEVWLQWINNGTYTPLATSRSSEHRTKDQQLPSSTLERRIVSRLVSFFKNHPEREYAFEKCAAEIALLMDGNIVNYDLTRFRRDGGRDALGIYKIGSEETGTKLEFALEAKCKDRNNGSGVKETSRLISRLRHRQFGIFVTTSYVGEQAYKEIIEDKHPIIIIAGRDIAKILIRNGYSDISVLDHWLESNFR